MPIKSENKKLYPKNWDMIRRQILARAGNKCESCGIKNHVFGYREKDGTFIETGEGHQSDAALIDGHKPIMIVLTIAHLNHNPTDNRPVNLKALCQRCHNRHDIIHRLNNARRTRCEHIGQIEMELK